MRAQPGDAHEENPADVADLTGAVSRRKLLGRGAVGAGLAVAGGALIAPRAAGAMDGDPVIAGQTVTLLATETGLSGSCTPSMLRLSQASTADDGLVVALSDSSAAGTGVNSSQAGTGPAVAATQTGTGVAITASTSGTNTSPAVTAAGTASLAANKGVVDVANSSTATTAYAVRAVSSGSGGAIFASASTAPAVTAQSSGSAAALFAKNTGNGPAVSVTNANNGAALLLTSGGSAVVGATNFNGTPSGPADKAAISVTSQSSAGVYAKSITGNAAYVESQGANDALFATNTGTSGSPHALTGYLSNAAGAGSAIYGSTNGAGAGVEGRSNRGRGGQFTGRVAQIRMLPGTGAHPSSGSPGDLFVDNHANLWFCKGGTNWKQIA